MCVSLLPHLSAGGVAQEREVCKKLLKFVNVSTTPMGVVAASNRGSQEKGEGKLERTKAVVDEGRV
jgi:hypothetical protein